LLQIELVRFAQVAWHAVTSAKAGRSRSRSAQRHGSVFQRLPRVV
jgi:hypothetical protein